MAPAKLSELLPMAARSSATRQFLIDQKHLLTAYAFGFMASVGVVVLGVALQSSQIIAGTPAPKQAIIAVDNRTSAFAAAPLMAVPHAIEQRAATIDVAGEIEAPVGHAVPFPLDVSLNERATQVRISDLPPYAGLSAGVPEESGAWLVDAEAALGLRMTAYAAQSGPQDVSIEWLDADGKPLATAHTRVTVSAAAANQQPVIAAPAAIATLFASEDKTNASAAAEAPVVEATPIIAPRPIRVTAGTAATLPANPVEVAADAEAKAVAAPVKVINAGAKPVAAPVKVIKAEPQPAPAPVKIVKAEPKPTPAPVKITAAEPKPAVSRPAKRARTESAGAVAPTQIAAVAPSPSLPQQRLPWSNSWMRSTLGMGPSGR